MDEAEYNDMHLSELQYASALHHALNCNRHLPYPLSCCNMHALPIELQYASALHDPLPRTILFCTAFSPANKVGLRVQEEPTHCDK